MFRFIIELLLWIPISFALAGCYWFLGGLVFGAPIVSLFATWRGFYIICVGLRICVLVITPIIRYFQNLEKEWDSNARYLKWAKECAKDPGDW